MRGVEAVDVGCVVLRTTAGLLPPARRPAPPARRRMFADVTVVGRVAAEIANDFPSGADSIESSCVRSSPSLGEATPIASRCLKSWLRSAPLRLSTWLVTWSTGDATPAGEPPWFVRRGDVAAPSCGENANRQCQNCSK
jgi:hypothetical protein